MSATAESAPHLVHQAFEYASREEFVAHMVPFVREGQERGDSVVAVTGPQNIDALREALGDAAADVDFRDAAGWYRQPYRTLQAYDRYVTEHARDNIVRVIGEPVWDGRSPGAVREWTRYESVINVAFASSPAWIVCPYDASSLPDHVVRHARHTHPEVLGRGGAQRSEAFRTPDRLVEALPLEDAGAPPAGASVLTLDVDGDLGVMRRLVADQAKQAGLHADRAGELALAASELATNAARHGRRPIVVRLWRDAAELVCEVEDRGAGFADRLTGYALPSPKSPTGRGLWIVRQLCDCVDVVRRDGAFAVRARVSLAPAAA